MVAAGTAGLAIGFLVGLFVFRIKSRWCDRCGSWTQRRPADLGKVGGGRG